MDGRFKRYSNGSNACIDDDDKLYGNRHNQWMQQHSGIYGHGESKSKHKCKLPEHLCRSDSELISNGRDELYVDRRTCLDSDANDTSIEQYNNLYGYGYAEQLYRQCGCNGHGHRLTKRHGHFSKHLLGLNGYLTGEWCDELYVDRRPGVNSHTDHPSLDHDDDLYGNGNNGKLQQNGSVHSNGECFGPNGYDQFYPQPCERMYRRIHYTDG